MSIKEVSNVKYYDYEATKTLKFYFGNREIDEKVVRDFYNFLVKNKDNINTHPELGAYQCIPVVIDACTNNIIDAQHRLIAYFRAIEDGILNKEVGIVVGNYICYESVLETIKSLNTIGHKWGGNTFGASATQMANLSEKNDNIKADETQISMKKLHQFCNSHVLFNKKYQEGKELEYDSAGRPRGISNLRVRYAANTLKGTNQQLKLKASKFTVTDEELELGHIIHNELLEFATFLYGEPKLCTAWENIIPVWHRFRDRVTVAEVIGKLQDKDIRYAAATSGKKYWESLLQEIVNSHAQN